MTRQVDAKGRGRADGGATERIGSRQEGARWNGTDICDTRESTVSFLPSNVHMQQGRRRRLTENAAGGREGPFSPRTTADPMKPTLTSTAGSP